MLDTILIVFAVLALGAGALAAAPAGSAAATFYVAPNGNDRWSGMLAKPNAGKTDGPFATVARTRDAVRERRAQGQPAGPVRVVIAGGTYPLPETLVFRPEDSGTPEAPVTYAAAPGARPILSGGRRVTGWQRGEGPLWTARIPEVAEGKWYFHQLFVNGSRRTRARTPNEGYLRAAGPLEPLANREEARRDRETKIGFRFQGEEIRPWQNLEDVNVIVYHAWTASWHHIAAVDAQERTVRFTAPSGWPMGYWEREQRYVVENCREALDSPGEWYLDRKTGVLTYWPPAGEDPNQVEVTAPVLRALVKFAGDGEAGQWVEHIRLEGLSFQHADWDLARDKSADGQAATFLGAAVSASGTRQCALERCEIAHVGEHALWLQRACQENRLVQCHLHDMGAGGVYVGEGARATVPTTSTRGNLVHNNFIHDGGHVFAAGIGVWVGQSANNTISHNEVCDLYYSGMSLGWT